MLFFGKKKKKGALHLLLDIRSASVGGALLVLQEHQPPRIIYTTRHHVFFETTANADDFVHKLMRCLDLVLGDIEKEGIKKNATIQSDNHVSVVTCMLASPWYKSKIKNAELHNNTPTAFTKELYKKIIAETDTTQKKGEAVIEHKPISVHMNGYTITNPIGKKAKDIIFSFYHAIISAQTKQDITEKISSRFYTNTITFHTHPYVVLSVIQSLFRANSNFVFLDIGGETTDIGIFRNSKLEDVVTVPFGTHYFLRKIMKTYNLDVGGALSHIQMLYNDALQTDVAEKTRDIVARMQKEWISSVQVALEKKWNKEITPPTVFISSDREVDGLLKDLVTSKDFYTSCLKINREPIVHVLHHAHPNHMCTYEQNTTEDALLATLAIHVVATNG